MRTSARVLGIVLAFLCVADSLVWYAAVAENHRGILTVSFLKGGAIFITTPSGRQVLVDGGFDNSVARQLGSFMPLYDRSIDVVIARAPDPARTNGLVDVLSRYRVSYLAQSAARSGAPQEAAFDTAVAHAQERGMRVVELQRGQVIDLGSGAALETLFPDRDASSMGASDGCLILKLMYGDTSFLFSCSSPAIETYLAGLDGNTLKSDVVFARTDVSALLAGFADPHYAVAASACGAQNADASTFARFSVPIFDTCVGSVTFGSDARTVWKE